MASKGKLLKEYTIKINAEVNEAEQELSKLQSTLKSKDFGNVGTEIKTEMEKASDSIKQLSVDAKQKFAEIQSSLRKINTKELQSQMTELSKNVTQSVSVIKEQVALLTSLIDGNINFDTFVAKFSKPFADLTVAIKNATDVINNLQIKVPDVDTSSLKNATKTVLNNFEDLGKSIAKKSSSLKIDFSINDKDIEQLAKERNAIEGLLELIDRYNKNSKTYSNIPSVTDYLAGGFDIPSLRKYSNALKTEIGERTEIAKKAALKDNKTASITVPINVSGEITDENINSILDHLKTEIETKVQNQLSKKGISIYIPVGFGTDVNNENIQDAVKDLEGKDKDTKSLFKALNLTVTGSKDQLQENINSIIDQLNLEFAKASSKKIRIQIEPIAPIGSDLNNAINDTEEQISVAQKNGARVSFNGGTVSITGDGVAQESTLSEIRDLLSGSLGKIASKKEVKEDPTRVYKAIDDYRNNRDMSYVANMINGKTINKEYIEMAKASADALSKTRYLYDLRTTTQDAKKSKTLDELLASDLANKSIKGKDGKEYALYSSSRMPKSAEKEFVSLLKSKEFIKTNKVLPEGDALINEITKRVNANFSEKNNGMLPTAEKTFDLVSKAVNKRINDVSKVREGRYVTVDEWKKILTDSWNAGTIKEFLQGLAPRNSDLKAQSDTLKANGVEIATNYDKEHKKYNVEVVGRKDTITGENDIRKELQSQAKDLTQEYVEQLQFHEALRSTLEEERELARDIVRLSADENSNKDELTQKTERLQALTKIIKGDTEEERVANEEQLKTYRNRQKELNNKKANLNENELNELIELPNKIEELYVVRDDIIGFAKGLLAKRTDGTSQIDAMIANEVGESKRLEGVIAKTINTYNRWGGAANPRTDDPYIGFKATPIMSGHLSKATRDYYESELEDNKKRVSKLRSLRVDNDDDGLTRLERNELKHLEERNKVLIDALGQGKKVDENQAKLTDQTEKTYTLKGTEGLGVNADLLSKYNKNFTSGSIQQTIASMTNEEIAESISIADQMLSQLAADERLSGKSIEEAVQKQYQDLINTTIAKRDEAIQNLTERTKAFEEGKIDAKSFIDSKNRTEQYIARSNEYIEYLSDPIKYAESHDNIDDIQKRFEDAEKGLNEYTDTRGKILDGLKQDAEQLRLAFMFFSGNSDFIKGLKESGFINSKTGKLDIYDISNDTFSMDSIKKIFSKSFGSSITATSLTGQDGRKIQFGKTLLSSMGLEDIMSRNSSWINVYDKMRNEMIQLVTDLFIKYNGSAPSEEQLSALLQGNVKSIFDQIGIDYNKVSEKDYSIKKTSSVIESALNADEKIQDVIQYFNQLGIDLATPFEELPKNIQQYLSKFYKSTGKRDYFKYLDDIDPFKGSSSVAEALKNNQERLSSATSDLVDAIGEKNANQIVDLIKTQQSARRDLVEAESLRDIRDGGNLAERRREALTRNITENRSAAKTSVEGVKSYLVAEQERRTKLEEEKVVEKEIVETLDQKLQKNKEDVKLQEEKVNKAKEALDIVKNESADSVDNINKYTTRELLDLKKEKKPEKRYPKINSFLENYFNDIGNGENLIDKFYNTNGVSSLFSNAEALDDIVKALPSVLRVAEIESEIKSKTDEIANLENLKGVNISAKELAAINSKQFDLSSSIQNLIHEKDVISVFASFDELSVKYGTSFDNLLKTVLYKNTEFESKLEEYATLKDIDLSTIEKEEDRNRISQRINELITDIVSGAIAYALTNQNTITPKQLMLMSAAQIEKNASSISLTNNVQRAEDVYNNESRRLNMLKQEGTELEKQQLLLSNIASEQAAFAKGIKASAIPASKEVDSILLEMQNHINAFNTQKEKGSLGADFLKNWVEEAEALEKRLESAQKAASEMGLKISDVTGRAYRKEYTSRETMQIPGVSGEKIGDYIADAKERQKVMADTKAKVIADNAEIQKQSEQEKQTQDYLTKSVLKAYSATQKLKDETVKLKKETLNFLKGADYAGMSQEQADLANKMRRTLYQTKGLKEATAEQKKEYEGLVAQAKQLGLNVAKNGNPYLPDFKKDNWRSNPIAYDTNTFTHKALYGDLLNQVNPEQLALESTQVKVLAALTGRINKNGWDTKGDKWGKSKKKSSKGYYSRDKLPQDVRDARAYLNKAKFKDLKSITPEAKSIIKDVIKAGWNVELRTNQRKTRNGKPIDNIVYVPGTKIADKGATKITQELAKEFGITLAEKATEQVKKEPTKIKIETKKPVDKKGSEEEKLWKDYRTSRMILSNKKASDATKSKWKNIQQESLSKLKDDYGYIVDENGKLSKSASDVAKATNKVVQATNEEIKSKQEAVIASNNNAEVTNEQAKQPGNAADVIADVKNELAETKKELELAKKQENQFTKNLKVNDINSEDYKNAAKYFLENGHLITEKGTHIQGMRNGKYSNDQYTKDAIEYSKKLAEQLGVESTYIKQREAALKADTVATEENIKAKAEEAATIDKYTEADEHTAVDKYSAIDKSGDNKSQNVIDESALDQSIKRSQTKLHTFYTVIKDGALTTINEVGEIIRKVDFIDQDQMERDVISSFNNVQSDVSNKIASMQNMGFSVKGGQTLTAISDRIKGANTDYSDALKSDNQEERIKAAQTLVVILSQANKELDQLLVKEGRLTIDGVNKKAEGYKKQLDKINPDNLSGANLEAYNKLQDELDGILVDLSKINRENILTDPKEAEKLAELSNRVNKLGESYNQLSPAIKNHKSLFVGLGSTLTKLTARYITFYQIFNVISRSFNQGIQTVKSYDAALTSIKYTMNMTEDQFNNLGKATVQMARDLNMSVDNAMQISQIYANMQTTSEEILNLGKPTAILSNLTGVSTDTAANQIQSVMQQFKLAEDQASHIVDVYDKISASIKMDYAKGIENISSGVQAAGSVAYDAGLSFEQLAAVIAKTTERTREDGSAIGQAVKTIAVRISKASKLSGADEVDNETVSKAAKALHDIGVEVYNSNGSFRELDVILGELAERWGNLTDAQQANIAFEVAATRQTNKFRAILDSWTESQELANDAAYASGNAMANQQKYEESLAGITQSISTEMNAFWLNTLDSDLLKTFLSGIKDITVGLNSLGDTIGGIPTTGIISAAGLLGLTFGDTFISTVRKTIADTKGGIGPALVSGIKAAIGLVGGPAGMAVTAIVAGAAIGVAHFIAVNKESIKAAKDSAEQLKKEQEQIESYSERIKELQDVRDDSNSTDQQVYEAKQNLLSIQNDLIDTYGKEAEKLDLVNGKYAEQQEILKNLTREKANEWLADVQENGKSNQQIYEKYAEDLAKVTTDSVNTGLTNVYKLPKGLFDGIQNYSFNNGTGVLNITGTAEERAESYKLLRDRVNEYMNQNRHDLKTDKTYDRFQEFLNNVSQQLTKTQDWVDERLSFARQGATFSLSTLQDSNGVYGDKILNNYLEANQKYIDAMTSGASPEEVDQARSNFENAKAAWDALINDAQKPAEPNFYERITDDVDATRTRQENTYAFKNDPTVQNVAKKFYESGLSDVDIESGNFGDDVEQAKDLEASLKVINNLGKAWGLTEDDVLSILKEQKSVLSNIKDEQKNITSFSKSDMVDAIGEMSDGFNVLADIYNDVKDGGDFDFSKLNTSKFKDAFKDLEKEYEEFIETVASSPDSIEKTQSAFNKLAEAFIKHNGAIDKITPETAMLFDEYMKLYGATVTYADGTTYATANTEALAIKEEFLANKTDDVSEADYVLNSAANGTITSLLSQKGATDATRVAFYNLCLQQINFNNSSLDVSGKIQALAQLEAQAYAAAGAMAAATSLSGAEAAWSEMDRVTQEGYGSKENYLNSYYNAHSDLFQHNLKRYQDSSIKIDYESPKSPGGGSGGSGGGGDSNKGESASYDLAEIAVENLERSRDRMKRIADDEARTYTERFRAFKDENDKLRQEALANLKKYSDEYNKLTNGNLDYNKRPYLFDPETGDFNTTLDEDYTIGEGESTFTIKIATILEDGTRLSPEQVQEYINSLDPTNAESLLASDKKNLIIQYAQGDFVEGMWDTLNSQLDAVKQAALEAYRAYEALKNNTDTVIEYDEALVDMYKQNVEAKKKIKDDAAAKVGELFGEDSARILDLLENGSMLPNEVELKFEAGEITKEQKEAIDHFLESIKNLYAAEDKLADGEKQLHDDRIEYYEKELELLGNILSLQQAQGELYEAEIDLKEATGQLITEGDYQVLIDNAEEVKKIYEQQIGVLQQEAAEMEPLSAEWYGVQAEIMNARTEMVQLTKQQAEWNEAIRKIPINLMDQYLSRLRAIRELVEGYQTIETAFGRNPEADSYQTLFGIGDRDITRMIEQSKEYQELLKTYEWGSTKYDETAEAIESISSEINSVIESMIEWNKTILNLPLEKFQALNDQMNLIVTSINDIHGEYDQVISAVTTAIDRQTEAIEKEQEAFDNGIDDQIKALQEQLDLLQKTNDEREHQNALSQAQYNLDKANHQRSIAVIRDGQLVYEADQEAIRQAQEELENAEYEMQVFRLQQKIDELEKTKEKQDELYADELDNLSKISDKWSEITENIQYARDALMADKYLKDGWLDKVLGRNEQNDTAIYEEFKRNYELSDKNLLSYENAVASNERIATLMEQYINEFMKGNITLAEAQAGIGRIAAATKDGLGVEETLSEYQSLFGNIFDTKDNSLATILGAMQGSASGLINGYLGNVQKDGDIVTGGWLALADQNNKLLDQYTTTWKELRTTVDKLLEQLEKDYQEALERSKALKHISKYLMDANEDGPDIPSTSVGWIDLSGDFHSGSYDGYGGMPSTPGTYHTGVKEGLVSASPNAKLKAFEDLTLKPLEPNEVPAILQKGELVLTQGQQGMLLRNASQLMQQPGAIASQGINVNLTMSNLTFHEISNGQDFANYITNNLSSAIAQGLARR